jgi:hypothetical protein
MSDFAESVGVARDDLIRMARQAGMLTWLNPPADVIHRFEAFAALVEATATEKANRRANASWARMCEKMAAAEREACAKLIETHAPTTTPTWVSYAAAIRARGGQP